MKKNIVIWGTKTFGTGTYYRLKDIFNVKYFVDNNNKVVGKKKCGIEVVSYDDVKELVKNKEIDVMICSEFYGEISKQLLEDGIKKYYVCLDGFVYKCEDGKKMIPCEIFEIKYYKKTKNNEKNILYLQNVPCVRTNKLAKLMKINGYRVFLLYTLSEKLSEKIFEDIYDEIWSYSTFDGIIDFLNGSDIDLVHCSNEPDVLASIASLSNKPVVSDVHDLKSLRNDLNLADLTLEYISNVNNKSNLYTSSDVLKIAKNKYNLDKHNAWEIKNYIFDEYINDKLPSKCSDKDGEIHCVYEGGIEIEDGENPKAFFRIWNRLMSVGIHVHVFTNQHIKYCLEYENKNKYFHYEGDYVGQELIKKMAKFDYGLAVYNQNKKNEEFISSASPNKIYEYINAGLPVVFTNKKMAQDFVEKYKVGVYLDLQKETNDTIKRKLIENKKCVNSGFLNENKLTMVSHENELIKFYERAKNEN